MKKIVRSLSLVSASVVPLSLVISCGTDAQFDPSLKDSVIMMVGGVGHEDQGFLQMAYDGTMKAKNEIEGFKQYSEVKTASSNIPDAQQAAKNALAAGAYTILGVGYQYPTFMNGPDYAGKYPDRQFIALDGVATDADNNMLPNDQVKDNVTTVSFNAEQSSFLAGVVGGLYLAKNYADYQGDGGLKVGAWGGLAFDSVTAMLTGFAQGLAYYNDNLALDDNHKVHFVGWNGADNGFSGAFTPNDKAITITESLVSKNVDLIFSVSGGAVSSTVDTLKTKYSSKNIKLIGVDSDQTIAFGNEGGDYFITSAMKDTGQGAYEAFRAVYGVEGALVKQGQNNLVGLLGNFVRLAPGKINNDEFKGNLFKDLIKNEAALINVNEDAPNIYEQLNSNQNEINKYGQSAISDWTKGKIYFDAANEKIPTLSDFN